MSDSIFATTVNKYFEQWKFIPWLSDTWMESTSQRNHRGRKKVAELVKKNSKSILDVGCGIGLDYEYYKDSDVQYLGVDITKRFLEECQKRGVPAQHGDVLDLEFDENSFDTVYCKDLLLHLPVGYWRQALAEMTRVAGKQVITLEPEWVDETVYTLREKHSVLDPSTKQPTTLLFFHNVYSQREIVMFAAANQLTVSWWRGKDVERSAWTREASYWQVTLFTKNGGE